MMKVVDHKAIGAREAAATDGPWDKWHALDGSGYVGVRHGHGGGSLGTVMFYIKRLLGPQDSADADFIAHARTDIPDLLEEIDLLTAKLLLARKAAPAPEKE